MSPDLFSVFAEMIMRKIEDCEGIKVGGRNINNIRYADDTALVADSSEKLQHMLNVMNEEGLRRGQKINFKKTKYMVIGKEVDNAEELVCSNEKIPRVAKFNYLGSIITADGRCEEAIKQRIGIAKTAFRRMESMLTNRKMTLKTRKNAAKTYIWSKLLYGAETWTISKTMEARIEAMEMWIWRRLTKIPWAEKRTNISVLQLVGEKREMMKAIRKRQLQFFGHIMRREGAEKLSLTGMIEGRRGRGRPREKYMTRLCQLFRGGPTPVEVIRSTQDRTVWKNMVADVLEDMAR